MDSEKLFISKLEDKIRTAQERSYPAKTGFLTLDEQDIALRVMNSMHFTNYCLDGGYEGAERAMLVCLPDYMDSADVLKDDAEHLCVVRASFSGEITHRDILGSLMACGVKREVLGDLLVGNCCADIIVTGEMCPYLMANYLRAGKYHVSTQVVARSQISVPEAKFEMHSDTVASLRLDCVLSVGFRIPRTKAAAWIAAGNVRINQRTVLSSDKHCEEGDIISARGYGKCMLDEIGGKSKKDRIFIRVKRYL